jgi:hypothetical protein
LKRDEILKRLKQINIDMSITQIRSSGIRALYTGAVMAGQNDVADEKRAQIHAILDEQLDLEAASILLSRAYLESAAE